MKTSDNYLLLFIWGLLFIILSLPALATVTENTMFTVTNHQGNVAECIPPSI